MGAWALSSASVLCLVRRLRDAALAAPAPVAVGVALLLASPILLHRAGEALAEAIGSQLAATDVARGLVLALCLSGAMVGLMIGVVAPPRSAMGAQLSAAPVGMRASNAAMVLLPLAIGSSLVAPLALAFVLPIAGSAPGGVSAAASTVGAVVAASSLGLFAAECVRTALRRDRGVALAALAASAGWALCAWLGSSLALGPLVVAADAIAGVRPVWFALLVEALLAFAALGGWSVVVVRGTPRVAARPPRVVLRTPAGTSAAVAVAVIRLVMRRMDVRLAFAAGVALGLSSIALASAAATARIALAGSSVALAAALAPLALTGILLDGRSVWRSSPVRAGAVIVPACSIVLVLALVPVTAVVAVVVAVMRDGASDCSRVLLVAALTAGAALAGGGLVPWQGNRLGDQLASFGAFAACAAVATVGAGIVGPRLVAAGATRCGSRGARSRNGSDSRRSRRRDASREVVVDA